jgi:hypothetical protein
MSEFWLHPSAAAAGGGGLAAAGAATGEEGLAAARAACWSSRARLMPGPGNHGAVRFLEWTLVFGRVDALSQVFGYIMALMCGGRHAVRTACARRRRACGGLDVCGGLSRRDLRRRLPDPVPVLGTDGVVLGVPGLVPPARGVQRGGLRYFLVHMAGGCRCWRASSCWGRPRGRPELRPAWTWNIPRRRPG